MTDETRHEIAKELIDGLMALDPDAVITYGSPPLPDADGWRRGPNYYVNRLAVIGLICDVCDYHAGGG